MHSHRFPGRFTCEQVLKVAALTKSCQCDAVVALYERYVCLHEYRPFCAEAMRTRARSIRDKDNFGKVLASFKFEV